MVQVLDARDPLGCRSKQAESFILQSGKRLIFLLNKSDLVPRENLEGWLQYLRNEQPTFAFCATTQKQRRNLSTAFGTEAVMAVIKNYSRDQGIKTAITVGVVGMPNVGKSSFINSLRRERVCNVGSKPGITRALQEVVLDGTVRLLDGPGVVLCADPQSGEENLLRNVVSEELIGDPVSVVEVVARKIGLAQLAKVYQVNELAGSVTELLFLISKARGKVGKGGVPDLEGSARVIIHDWNRGAIPFYSIPPKRTDTLESSLLTKLSEEYSVAERPNPMEVN